MEEQAAIRRAMRQRRRLLGLTQEQAAVALGMERLSYHRIENGARRIRFDEIVLICAAFNFDRAELLGVEAGFSPILQATIASASRSGPLRLVG
jgi:transcriptional regulator with XRE-family HTH domain